MTISCSFRNSPLVSFWSGLVAPCRRESRLKSFRILLTPLTYIPVGELLLQQEFLQ